MRIVNSLLCTCVLVTLAACGGGGGNGDGSSPADLQSLNGLFVGDFTQEGAGTFEFEALIHNGQFFGLSIPANRIYHGSITTTDSDSFSGTVTAYEINGGAVETVSAQGVFDPQSFVNGSFEGSSGSQGTFGADFDDLYLRDSSLDLTNDVWSRTDGSYTLTISIDPDGSYTGSDTDGCNYSGNIGIIDSDFNIYSLTLAASSCGAFDGNYDGFVFLDDSQSQNDAILVVAANQNFVFLDALLRQ